MSETIEHGTAAVNWPGVVLHDGDPELVYVAGLADWERDAGTPAAGYAASDCLIDASGSVFTLTAQTGQRIVLQPRGDSKSLVEMLGLVKAHAAQAGSCCVAKLYAPTIADALAIVAALQDG